MNLNSFIVLSHAGLKMCVSTQSRFHRILIQVSRFASHLPQVPWFTPPFHPCGFSPQSRSLCLCLISIHVTSHLHPGSTNCISAPYKHPHNPIKDSRYVSHLHPGPISSGSGSKDFSLTSIHVLSQPNPGPYSHITPPSKQCLNSIQVLIFMCHLNPGHLSPPSRSEDVWYISINALSHLQSTSTHVLISAYHHHPGDVSPPSSSRNLHLSSIQVLSQIHPGLKMCASHPFRPCLRFIQVTEFLLHLHPSTAYPPSRSCIHISHPSRC